MRLQEIASKYFLEENHNCAESVLRGASDFYGLALTEKDIRLVGAYGAGMQTGNTCGAILSAVAVLSLKYVETVAHASKDVKPAVTLLVDKFNAKFGSLQCKDIKPVCFEEGKRCVKMVVTACDLLEEVLAEYGN